MENDKKENKATLSHGSQIAENEEGYGTLVVHGDEYTTLLPEKYKNRKQWQQPNEKLIYSYIPGTILSLYVKTGETVKKDQPLLILEAMKMENTIFAPFNGKLKSVNVKQDDRVPKGTVMIEFE